jgi:serine/threonine protein kinase
VRKVSDGFRADVYLAHPLREAPDARPAAIKIFRPGVTEQSIMVEIEALSRSNGAHVIELVDLTTAPDGRPALILARYANGTLARLSRERAEFRPGESTTILVPLTLALRRLHDSGVVHAGIRPDAVLFDAAGTPTLGCFGRARLFPPALSTAARDAEAAFSADLESVRQLAGMVLGRVRDDRTRTVLDWLNRSDPSGAGWLDALDDQLFSLGEPTAIDLRPDAPALIDAVPSRLVPAQPIGSPSAPNESAGRAIPEVLARLLPPQLLELDVVAQLRHSLSTVRPRFWVAGAAAIALLLLAVMLIPREKPDTLASPPTAGSTSSAGAPDAGPIVADDPAAAAGPLLAARESCIRDLSVLCLDSVVQPDSSASMADQDLIRGIQNGDEIPAPWSVATGEAVLNERLGDSAIVSLSDAADDEPASLLLMKSEAGWRIRDYLME